MALHASRIRCRRSANPARPYLAAYAGLAPVTRRFGTSIRGEHPPKGGNNQLKRAFFLSAFATLTDPARAPTTVLERQLGKDKVRFDASDRAFLTALLHRLPRDVLRRVRLLVRPDTVLRWHRDLLARRHAAVSRPKRPGRPRTVHSVRVPVLRLARDNPSWGYRRLHGELLVLGVKVAASTVREILQDAGIDPAPERAASTWADFLRSQADALLACDFLETVPLTGARMYVFAVIALPCRCPQGGMDMTPTFSMDSTSVRTGSR